MNSDQVVDVHTHCHVGLQWSETERLFSFTVCVAVVVLCVDCSVTLSSAATLVC